MKKNKEVFDDELFDIVEESETPVVARGVVYNTVYLNVRKQPSTTGEIVSPTLQTGEYVCYDPNEENGFVHLISDTDFGVKREGWVMKKYIKEV